MPIRPRELAIVLGMAAVAIASVLIARSEIAEIERRRVPLLAGYTRSIAALDDVEHLARSSARNDDVARKEFAAALARLDEHAPMDIAALLERIRRLAVVDPAGQERSAAIRTLTGQLKTQSASFALDLDRLIVERHRHVLMTSWAGAAVLLVLGLLLVRHSVVCRQSRDVAEAHAAELDANLSCLPQAVWVRGPEGVLSANRGALDLFGVESRDELNGDVGAFFERFQVRSADSGLPLRPEDSVFAGVRAGAAAVQDIVMRPRNAAHDVVVRVRAAPLKHAGRRLGVIVAATDVTEQMKQEHKIRVSEATLAGIIAMATDAIITVDESHLITRFNQGAERMFGHRWADMMGQPLDVLIPLRFRGAHSRHLREFAAGETSVRPMESRAELRALRRTGEEFPAEASISKLKVDGHLTMVAVMRDVTERQRREAELAILARAGKAFSESLERHDIVDHLAKISASRLADHSFVYVTGPDGLQLVASAHGDRAPGAASDADACDCAGDIHEVAGIVRTGAAQLIPSITTTPADAGGGEGHDARNTPLRSVLTVPIWGRGRVLGALHLTAGAFRRSFDARDTRLVEDLASRAGLALENSRLYADALRATQLRDDVLAVVAHDLRTPLNSIIASTRLLTLYKETGGSEKEIAARIGAIMRAGYRMNALVQDLIEVGRMESGRFVMELAPVAPLPLITQLLEEYHDLVHDASLQLTTEIEGDLPDMQADRQRLLQVFENLVGNALKFTPPGGRISVGARHEGASTLFWVSDTGPGIAQTDIDRLFERFWQGYSGDRRGLGLGLSICKAITEAHHGRLWVQSQIGFGTTFYFSIPQAPPEAAFEISHDARAASRGDVAVAADDQSG